MDGLLAWFRGRAAVGEGKRPASGDTTEATPRSRRVSVEMVNQIGDTMLEQHHVPDTFRDTILAGVLQARSSLGGGSDDLLSDGEWTAIREAEVRLLFLVAIKSKLSLGRQLNFNASSDYGFVSPQLKKPILINAGMWGATSCCLFCVWRANTPEYGGMRLLLECQGYKPWCGSGKTKNSEQCSLCAHGFGA